MKLTIEAAERGWLPPSVLRWGIRRRVAGRLAEEIARGNGGRRVDRAAAELKRGPFATHQSRANEQHYELPPEFFRLVLGEHLKYSCGLWENAGADLDAAEAAMLELTCRRAGIEDGMRVLDLGCGWGSLSLWLAERYPRARVVALSNSRSQREYIEAEAARRGLRGLRCLTADVTTFDAEGSFDRVVSVEMFEHIRNYRQLLRRISAWLAADGRLFVHVFCHRRFAYAFSSSGTDDWMGRLFFAGGLMPSYDLFDRFQDDLEIVGRWRINGMHYERTANAWLANLEARRSQVSAALEATYGADVELWVQRWRLFFMACAELFGYDHGEQWGVGHYLWRPR